MPGKALQMDIVVKSLHYSRYLSVVIRSFLPELMRGGGWAGSVRLSLFEQDFVIGFWMGVTA